MTENGGRVAGSDNSRLAQVLVSSHQLFSQDKSDLWVTVKPALKEGKVLRSEGRKKKLVMEPVFFQSACREALEKTCVVSESQRRESMLVALTVGLEHLKTETRLRGKRFESVGGTGTGGGGHEIHYWQGTESGLLRAFEFQGTCTAGDGSCDTDSKSMRAGFCNCNRLGWDTQRPLPSSSLQDQRTLNSRKVGREDEGVSSSRPELVSPRRVFGRPR